MTPPEALRILDANLNRAREGLRVVEEYFRFVLNASQGAEACKALRHELQHAAEVLPLDARIASRDNEGDVGTSLNHQGETSRSSLDAIARANLGRVSEALRAIEEYAKLGYSSLSSAAKDLRYRVYQLESSLAKSAKRAIIEASTIMAILGGETRLAADDLVDQLVAAGVTTFQIREKQSDEQAAFAATERWMNSIRRHEGLCVLINDRVDWALALDADGVHLGQDDMPFASARKALGPTRLIGLSTHHLAEAEEAYELGADYIGAGAVFETSTKEVEHRGGVAWAAEATSATPLAAFAIGGINADNIAQLASAGVKRVAIASALTTSDQPGQVAAEIIAALRV